MGFWAGERCDEAEDVEVGPYAIIGPNVTIGKGSVIGSHAVIEGWTTIGEYNQIFHHASVGTVPHGIAISPVFDRYEGTLDDPSNEAEFIVFLRGDLQLTAEAATESLSRKPEILRALRSTSAPPENTTMRLPS